MYARKLREVFVQGGKLGVFEYARYSRTAEAWRGATKPPETSM